MNKIYMVKRNAYGQSVVCSEKTKARGKVKSIALVVAGLMVSSGVMAAVNTTVTGDGSTLVTSATDDGGFAMTFDGTATVERNAIAIGKNSYAKGYNSLAIGTNSYAYGENASANATAINGVVKNGGGVAIGGYVEAGGVAIGGKAIGMGSLAIGSYSTVANHSGDLVIGINSSLEPFNDQKLSTIVGHVGRTAVGTHIQNMSGVRGTALGNFSSAQADNSVALGYYSWAATEAGISGYLANGSEEPTWKSTFGAVSIGFDGYEHPTRPVLNISQKTRQITNLAAGTKDTDAVNVAQLKVVKALADTKVDKDYVDSAIKNFVDSTLITIDDIAAIVNDAGFNITTSDGATTNHQLGETITVDGGKNIVTKTDDKGAVHVAMKDDIEVKSVSVEGSTIAITQDGINAGDKKVSHVADGTVAIDSKEAVNGSQLFAVKDTADKAHQTAQLAEVKASDAQSIAKTAQAEAKVAKSTSDKAIATVEKLNDTAVKYDDSSKDKVTLSGSQGTTIANVKDGAINATSQDAVNGRQLHATNTQVMKNTQSINQLNGRVNQLDGKINKVNKEARAGIAGAAAIAGLPQVRGNGKSMLAAAVGNYKGQNAIALGYTRSSDNGKLLLKLGGSANTQGDIVSSVGIGYEW